MKPKLKKTPYNASLELLKSVVEEQKVSSRNARVEFTLIQMDDKAFRAHLDLIFGSYFVWASQALQKRSKSVAQNELLRKKLEMWKKVANAGDFRRAVSAIFPDMRCSEVVLKLHTVVPGVDREEMYVGLDDLHEENSEANSERGDYGKDQILVFLCLYKILLAKQSKAIRRATPVETAKVFIALWEELLTHKIFEPPLWVQGPSAPDYETFLKKVKRTLGSGRKNFLCTDFIDVPLSLDTEALVVAQELRQMRNKFSAKKR